MTLEAYARERPQFRSRVMAHKKIRTVQLGDHLTLIFEDELTVRYQVQEMLRVERIFEEEGIEEELEAYNPLIPDGRNLKATMMLQYPEPEERRRRLERLIGIEDKVWVEVEGFERVWAIADEDLAFSALRVCRECGPGAQERRRSDDRGRASALRREGAGAICGA
jgi:hypothetical protein